jgi:hypothetical protein
MTRWLVRCRSSPVAFFMSTSPLYFLTIVGAGAGRGHVWLLLRLVSEIDGIDMVNFFRHAVQI